MESQLDSTVEFIMEEEMRKSLLLERLLSLDSDSCGPLIDVGGDSYRGGDIYTFFKNEDIIVIGRGVSDGNHVIIQDDETVSRNHCFIKYFKGDYYLLDLESLNGTKLNGEIVGNRQYGKLSDGDVISMGNSKFMVDIK